MWVLWGQDILMDFVICTLNKLIDLKFLLKPILYIYGPLLANYFSLIGDSNNMSD